MKFRWLSIGMFQCGHRFGVPFSSHLGQFIGYPEMEAVSGTHRYTGGQESLIDPVYTVIAFDRFARLGIPLRRPPGARGHACFTAYAEIRIHKDDAVLRSLLHGPGGAGRNTPWIFTVKARHEGVGGPGEIADKDGPHGNNFAELGTKRQTLVAFAGDFTTVAAYTSLCILKKVVLAHDLPLIS